MFVSDQATLGVSFEVTLVRLAALAESGALTRVSADAYAADAPPGAPRLARSRLRDLVTPAGPGAALLRLAGVYQAGPGEDGHHTAVMPLGGFLDRIAETIIRAGAAAG
jgi:hypothetical protein